MIDDQWGLAEHIVTSERRRIPNEQAQNLAFQREEDINCSGCLWKMGNGG
jgi:hypothetical protein